MKPTKWKILECTKCGLHRTRRQVVLGRGDLPADILFIGEGPGKSEDLRGEAFIGASGKLLDLMLKDALAELYIPREACKVYFTNIVLCHPTDEFAGSNRKPAPEEIIACAMNLSWLIKRASPRKIVLVGQEAEKTLMKEYPWAVSIHHPAFLLRTGGTGSHYYRSNIRILSEYLAV